MAPTKKGLKWLIFCVKYKGRRMHNSEPLHEKTKVLPYSILGANQMQYKSSVRNKKVPTPDNFRQPFSTLVLFHN